MIPPQLMNEMAVNRSHDLRESGRAAGRSPSSSRPHRRRLFGLRLSPLVHATQVVRPGVEQNG